MRITGTQYSIEKKPKVLELRKAGQVIETYEFLGKTVNDLTEEIWESLRRKGVTVNKELLLEDMFKMFPGVRRYGPIK